MKNRAGGPDQGELFGPGIGLEGRRRPGRPLPAVLRERPELQGRPGWAVALVGRILMSPGQTADRIAAYWNHETRAGRDLAADLLELERLGLAHQTGGRWFAGRA